MRFSVIVEGACHEKCLDVVCTLLDFELALNLHLLGLQARLLSTLEHIASKISAIPVISSARLVPQCVKEKPFPFSTEDLVPWGLDGGEFLQG